MDNIPQVNQWNTNVTQKLAVSDSSAVRVTMTYDHNQKSGNEGDVVKHVALVAALRSLLEDDEPETFVYADTFAAYAWNSLQPDGEWKKGILKLNGVSDISNTDIAWWFNTYTLGQACAGSRYPGSSRIALDVCRSLNRRIELRLWDIADGPVASLRKEYLEPHKVFHRSARSDEDAIRSSNFILIDPPDKSLWDEIVLFPKQRTVSQNILVWLPIGPNTATRPPKEDKKSIQCRIQGLESGLKVTKVRWATGRRTIGCQLLYAMPGSAVKRLRSAVEGMFSLMKWGANADKCVNVEHFDGPTAEENQF